MSPKPIAAFSPARHRARIPGATVLGAAMLFFAPAEAGDFALDWSVLDWPQGYVGPATAQLRDQYGFAVDARITVAGPTVTSGTIVSPDDLAIFGGSRESLVILGDAPANAGRVGDAPIATELRLLSQGIEFGVDNLRFDLLDLDPADDNATSDRCDFVTVSGDAGNPTLTPATGTPTVVIGPGPGSGLTGTLQANQAQCLYNEGPVGSATSDNDANGTLRLAYPDGTAVATVVYDESIGNVRSVGPYDPQTRGYGTLTDTTFFVSQAISLTRSVSPAPALQGQSVTYTYTVTNDGALPFNTGQDVVIEDDRFGTVSCPAITAPVDPGDSITCTTSAFVTLADAQAGSITTTATAGIGSIGQSFESRLLSTPESVFVATSVPPPPSVGGLACTPQSVFARPRTQTAGPGSAAAPTLDDVFVYDNVTTDIAGNPIDVVISLEQIAGPTDIDLSSGLLATMIAANDSYLTFRLRLVQDGTATPANPMGDAISQSAVNGVLIRQDDIDSVAEGWDASDVAGFTVTPTEVQHVGTAPLAGYPAPGTAVAMDPALFGDPTNWTDEPGALNDDYYVIYRYETFVEGTFIHGFTGSNTSTASRGAGLRLCAVAETSATVVAEDDDYTDPVVDGVAGGTAGQVLDNDTINGLAAAPAGALLRVLVPAAPVAPGDPVPSLATDGADEGVVTVPPGTPTGIYSIDYELCSAAVPDECDRATATVRVFSGAGVDLGDAPAGYGAPSHGVPFTVQSFLGRLAPDADADPLHGLAADGDDLGGVDDEESVSLPALAQGVTVTLEVAVTGPGVLQGWIDFDGDGLFEDAAGERIATDRLDDASGDDNVAGDGTIQVRVPVPADATTAQTYARFRFATESLLGPDGFSEDGEVEDYPIAIARSDFVDRGDAPASFGDPRHTVMPDFYLGLGLPDTDQQTRHSAGADGDDLEGIDDEDALEGEPVFAAGTTVPVTVRLREPLAASRDLGLPLTQGAAFLQAWVDFDRSGTFEPSEQVATDVQDGGAGDSDGAFDDRIVLQVPVPATVSSGFGTMRLRWSLDAAAALDPFDGWAPDGEVEDHRVTLSNGAVPFTCDGTLYRIARVDSQLEQLVFTDLGGGAYSVDVTPVGPPAGAAYNGGWGYNALDGLFYAVREYSRDLVRVDRQGNFEVVAQIPATAADGYNSGDILANGIMVYRVEGTNDFQLLDLTDPSNPVDAGRITLTGAVDPFDIAFNPNDGFVYGVNHVTDRLFYFDAADGTPGPRTATEFGAAEWTEAYGAIWFDFFGRMYVNQNTTREIWDVDVGVEGSGGGTRRLIGYASIDEQFRNDGAGCPSRLGPLPPEGALSGLVYRDANYSGAFEEGETRLPAITVSLYDDGGTPGDTGDDTFFGTTETAADGTWLFEDVPASATWRVEVSEADPDLPAGTVVGTANPIEGIRVTAGSTQGGIDFGVVAAGSTADLSLTKEARDGTTGQALAEAAAGQAIDFVLRLSNGGSGAVAQARVRDLIPSGFAYVGDDSGGDYDPGTGIWTVTDLPPGGQARLTISVTMRPAGVHLNRAEIVQSSLPDPDSDPSVGAAVDDLGDGLADDDEAQAAVAYAGTGATLSGTVFLDHGASGAATAFDGLQGTGEEGSGRAVVRVLDGGGALIGTPGLLADGTWRLVLPDDHAGPVTVEVAAGEGLLIASETPAAFPALSNPDPRDGRLTFTPDPGGDHAGLDVGLIERARLNEDQSAAIRPGQVAVLRHEYVAGAPGTVTFALTPRPGPGADTFTAAVFVDADCDGMPETALAGAVPVARGATVCVTVRVSSSSGAAPGTEVALDLTATTTYGATGLSEVDANVDRVRVDTAEGALVLRKTVRNVTQATAEGVTNGARAGDVLEYRITLENPGARAATDIAVHDRTVAYTVLAEPVPTPVAISPDVTCALAEPAANAAGYAGSLRWDCTGSLAPGARGSVTFRVRIQ